MSYYIKEIAVGRSITIVLMIPVALLMSMIMLHVNRRTENDPDRD